MEPPAKILRLHAPILTGLLIVINILVFLALMDAEPITDEILRDFWIYVDPGRIWEGAYWTLLSSAFVHFDFFLLLFNMIWLWGLGMRIEMIMGRQVLFALVFFGAIVTSAAQLALGQWPVLGATGVVYTLFGFMLASRRAVPLLALYLRPSVVRLLFIWLFLSLGLALAGVWPTGYAGPTGLVFGLAVGGAFVGRRWRVPAFIVILLFVVMSVASMTWLPWSMDWCQWRFAQAARAGQYQKALDELAFKMRRGDPRALNAAAWTLATAKEDKVRDGRRAVALARQAVDATQGKDPEIIDTLAAAYAEAGDWKEAEQTEVRALKAFDELAAKIAGNAEAQAKFNEARKQLEENLQKIRKRETIRE